MFNEISIPVCTPKSFKNAWKWFKEQRSDSGYPLLSINDIVGVQPLQSPIGNVYSMNYVTQKYNFNDYWKKFKKYDK